MSVLPRISTVSLYLVGLLVWLAMAEIGNCQTDLAEEAESAPTPTSDEAMEEVVVIGQKHLMGLHRNVYEAEDRFYLMFNSLNSDDEFDIKCRRERRHSTTRIPTRICKANFVREITGNAFRFFGYEGYARIDYARIKAKEKQLYEEIQTLTLEHPELLEALSEYDDVNRIFRSEVKRRCKGTIFSCEQ
jgi:hypothetical protein